MTILFTTDHYIPTVNGVVMHVMLLKKELEKRGHRVIVVTPRFGKRYKKQPDVFYLPAIPIPLRAKELLAIPFDPIMQHKIEKLPIDIVHNHLFFTGFFGMDIAQRKKIPTIVTYHTFIRQYIDWIIPWAKVLTHPTANWIAREYFGKHTAVIAPSQKAVEELQQAHVRTKIYTLHNGIDLAAFHNASPKQFIKMLSLSPQRPLVILVGLLEIGKNVDLAIRSIRELKKKLPSVQCVLIGDGTLRPKLQRLITKFHLKENVRITGFLDQDMIASANKAADVVLFTSDTDNFPTVLIEALAAGKPIVCIKDKAIVPLVHHEKNGIIVKKQPQHIAHALYRLLTDKTLAMQYGNASKQLSRQFSLQQYADKLEKIYTTLIAQQVQK